MQVTILGSGSALPTARRSSAGYLVEWLDGALLLDPSAGTYARALKAGLDPKLLRAVAVTHFHPDHTSDFPAILWARRQETHDTPLRFAGPPGLRRLVASFEAAYGHWLKTPVEIDGYPFECGGLSITAFPAYHRPESVCLRIEHDGKSIAFSGDTEDCEGLRECCTDADLALIECSSPVPLEGHMTPADCAAVVEAAAPKRVLLTHLGPDVATDMPCAEDGLVVPV